MIPRRRLDFQFTLGTGSFGDSGQDTVTVTGLRASAQIAKGGLPSLDQAELVVYGLTPTQLNTLSRLGKPLDTVRNNTVTVFAGDDVSGVSQVFTGTIMTSVPRLNDAPEVPLVISASSGVLHLARAVPPISFKGAVDVAVIANQIAASMGKAFVNHGVTDKLTNPYLPGTAVDQLRKLLQAVDINADMNGGPSGETLEIWPKGQAKNAAVPVLSSASGLVGYPDYTDVGVAVRALYRPGFAFGAQFNLETIVTNAVGAWYVLNMQYDLSSETPDGPWFMDIEATRLASGANV